MLLHHWEKCEGTIVARTPAKNQGSSNTWSATVWDFAVDVVLPTGEAFRAEVNTPTIMTDFNPPEVGAKVGVQVDKNRKVQFDKSDPRLSMKAFLARRRDADSFDDVLEQPAGTPPPADQ